MRSARTIAHVIDQLLHCELSDLPAVLLAELAEIIPVDNSGYYELDPQAQRFVVARHPEGFEVPPDINQRAAELHAEHPLLAYHQRTGVGTTLRISDLMSQEEFRAMRIYREVSSQIGAEYQMAFRLPGPQPLFIGVMMARSDRDFTESERDLCELLRSPLATIHASSTREALLHETVERHVASDHTAALIACEGDRLVALDDRATYLVARLQQGASHNETFTAWLHNARAGDVALEDPLPDRHHTTWTDDLGSLEIRHIPGRDGRDLLVVRDLNPDPAAVLQTLGLRPREAAVLELVMTGCNNHQIAQQLAITHNTVKKHLENTYRTLGVSTRTAAAAAGFEAVNSGSSPPRE